MKLTLGAKVPRDAHHSASWWEGQIVAEMTHHLDVQVAVIGGGIVGLGIAWAVAQSGRTVVVIDPEPAQGATYAAAGMLAPVSEMHYQEEDLAEFMLASSLLYPAFIDTLADSSTSSSGIRNRTGYQATTTLTLAADGADRLALADLQRVQQANGLTIRPLSMRDARELEPLLSPQLAGAFLAPDDHQVDPRGLARALRDSLAAHGRSNGWAHDIEIRQNALALIHKRESDAASRVTGVQLDSSRGVVAARGALTEGDDPPELRIVTAREVIVANGLAAAELGGLPPALTLPLRPVYGDILRLRVPQRLRPLLTQTVRGVVHGVPIYLVPRSDGTVVIGASQREDGESGVSAGSIYQLLRDAQTLVPAVSELELLEVTARARPGTPDNAPLLGRVSTTPGGSNREHAGEEATPATEITGLIIATGFFRHGVLLTPIAAQYCVQLLSGAGDPRWRAFRPDRFSHPPEISTVTEISAVEESTA